MWIVAESSRDRYQRNKAMTRREVLGGAHLEEAVGQGECQGGRIVTDRKSVGADDRVCSDLMIRVCRRGPSLRFGAVCKTNPARWVSFLPVEQSSLRTALYLRPARRSVARWRPMRTYHRPASTTIGRLLPSVRDETGPSYRRTAFAGFPRHLAPCGRQPYFPR